MARRKKKSMPQRVDVLLHNRRVQGGFLLVVAIVIGSLATGLVPFVAIPPSEAAAIPDWGTIHIKDSAGIKWNLGIDNLIITNPLVACVILEKYDYSIGNPISFTIKLINEGNVLLTMAEWTSELTTVVYYFNNIFIYTYDAVPDVEMPLGFNTVEYTVLVEGEGSGDDPVEFTGFVKFFVSGEIPDTESPVLGTHTIDVNTSDIDGNVTFTITAEDNCVVYEVWFYMSGTVEGYGDVDASGAMDVLSSPFTTILFYRMILHGSEIDFQYNMTVSYYFTAFDAAGNEDTSEIFTYTYGPASGVSTNTTITDTTPTGIGGEMSPVIIGAMVVGLIVIFGMFGKKQK